MKSRIVYGIAAVALTACSASAPSPTLPVTQTSTRATTQTPAKPKIKKHVVSPGAFCEAVGRTGKSAKGTVYVCKGPKPNRWRRP